MIMSDSASISPPTAYANVKTAQIALLSLAELLLNSPDNETVQTTSLSCLITVISDTLETPSV